MEQTIYQNWELDSLYDGGSRSERLKKLMKELRTKIPILQEALKSVGEDQDQLADILTGVQFVQAGWEEVDDFLICAYSDNVEDREAVNLMDESGIIRSELNTLQAELDQVLAAIPEAAWLEFTGRDDVAPLSFYLSECRERVQERLPLEQEKVISALAVNGFDGWEQLHGQLLTQLKFPLPQDGETEAVSVGQAYMQAMFANDRSVRQQTAAIMREVCASRSDLYASVLNRIAGFRLDVYRQRGWDNLLKELLEQNRIQEESLQAMLAAIQRNSDCIRTYLKRKAEVDGLDRLAWYDLAAPSFKTEETVPYEEAVRIITNQFHRFSPKLGEFADYAFTARWIEAENRKGKGEGGFCASLPLSKESRIFLTYRDTYQDVIVIAHELGHAYHNFILHEEPAFARAKGTSVAETASTFLENLVLDAAIDGVESDREKLALLEMKISNAIQYAGMLPNVFRFEQKLYEKRKAGLVSVEEIRQLLKAEENTLYEGIVEDLNDHIWMYTSHFYDTKTPFYNIPYTIGYLFSNGIYSLAKEKGTAFVDRYDELLRHSGRMTMEQLAMEYLGEDLTQPAFWDKALRPVQEAVAEYIRLTDKLQP
ncbi:oligoendopeptidase F [Planococcus lenghuensis]|uniref:Oligoendopeptidase F n=2 Tax=Planococcus lenghuensis TaxID=2213202 RepID=A0A1Q2L515_9BACL|nr:oligoendopeptidase F [Planococcus lenghuensis]